MDALTKVIAHGHASGAPGVQITGLGGGWMYFGKVVAKDTYGEAESPLRVFYTATCDCPHQCDYDDDTFLTAVDLGTLINVLFAGTPEVQDPGCPTSRGDFDCDGFPTALDIGGLADHLFAGGDPPCDPCAP